MKDRFSLVEYNGMKIPAECDCIWCGSKMKQGSLVMGSGVNEFSYWCNNCGAVVIHARDSSDRKINEYSIKYGFDNKERG